MCFSPEASFVAGAALAACGGVTLRVARQADPRFLALGAFPLFFGIQQLSEGVLWLSLRAPEAEPSTAAALFFLFFAYWFWPVWVPLSAALIEENRARRRAFWTVCGLGFGLGMFLYLPLLLSPGLLEISLARNSILYDAARVHLTEPVKTAARLVYAVLVCVPLIGSGHARVRGFGYVILASVIVGFVFAAHAFTSVWCFLAAICSVHVLFVLRGIARETPAGLMAGRH